MFESVDMETMAVEANSTDLPGGLSHFYSYHTSVDADIQRMSPDLSSGSLILFSTHFVHVV